MASPFSSDRYSRPRSRQFLNPGNIEDFGQITQALLPKGLPQPEYEPMPVMKFAYAASREPLGLFILKTEVFFSDDKEDRDKNSYMIEEQNNHDQGDVVQLVAGRKNKRN